MCDYSLAANRTRLARDGEQLILYRFPSNSLGLASSSELPSSGESDPQPIVTAGFHPHPGNAPPAVCVPPGARLQLFDIPMRLQRSLGVGAMEEVVFTQLHADANRYRDAVRFRNNQSMLLQNLAEGQRVLVLSVGLDEMPLEEQAAELVPTPLSL